MQAREGGERAKRQKGVFAGIAEGEYEAKFSLEKLPAKMVPSYVYARDFVQVLRKRTPEGYAETQEYKCWIMGKAPLQTVELAFKHFGEVGVGKTEVVKAMYEVSSEKMIPLK